MCGHMGVPIHCYTYEGDGIFLKIGVRWSLTITSWCHRKVCIPPMIEFYINIGCTWSVWASLYAVDGHMGVFLHCYTCAVVGPIMEILGMIEPQWLFSIMVEAVNLCWGLHPTSTLMEYEMFEHLYICCGWAYGSILTLLYLHCAAGVGA
jgi:hypothetical protein